MLWNQLWQALNFGSKALFLILLTPMMLSRWGSDGFGLFALASSLLVSMALLDGGVRALTRIHMADAWKRRDVESMGRIYAEGILTFASVSLVAIMVSAVLSQTGCLTAWFHLPPGGAGVLVMTVICTAVLMTSVLALEPLAAKGNLSTLKASNTWGTVVAIPLCALLVQQGAREGGVIVAYATCMTVPNLLVAYRNDLFAMIPWSRLKVFRPRTALGTLRSGFWYYLTTVSLIGKTHALSFLVSGIAGPAEAGIFYILLRFSEIISNVASTSSETSLAALTTAIGEKERHTHFLQSWLHVGLFSITGALMFLFLTGQLLGLWLHGAVSIPSQIGLGLAIFGLSGAFSRVVVNSSMGLDLTRPAALAGFAEALASILGAYFGYRASGLTGLFLGGSLGFFALLPVSSRISRRCGFQNAASWIRSLSPLFPGFFISGVIFYEGSRSSHGAVYLEALLLVSAIILWQLRMIQGWVRPPDGEHR